MKCLLCSYQHHAPLKFPIPLNKRLMIIINVIKWPPQSPDLSPSEKHLEIVESKSCSRKLSK